MQIVHFYKGEVSLVNYTIHAPLAETMLTFVCIVVQTYSTVG